VVFSLRVFFSSFAAEYWQQTPWYVYFSSCPFITLVVFSFDGARNRTGRMNGIQSVCEDRVVSVRDTSSFLCFCVYCYVDMLYFLNPSKNWMALVSGVGVPSIFKLFTVLICTWFFLFFWVFLCSLILQGTGTLLSISSAWSKPFNL
jgi:hypothetical protein